MDSAASRTLVKRKRIDAELPESPEADDAVPRRATAVECCPRRSIRSAVAAIDGSGELPEQPDEQQQQQPLLLLQVTPSPSRPSRIRSGLAVHVDTATADAPTSMNAPAPVEKYPEYLAQLFVSEREQLSRTAAPQRIISATMRDIVVGWLMEMRRTFHITFGTCVLAMYYFDHTYATLAAEAELEAVLAACLMLAYKFYEPDIRDTRVDTVCIAECCDGAITPNVIKKQELAVAKLLQWKLNSITFYHFAETILGMSLQGLRVDGTQNPQLYEYLCEIFCHIALKDDAMMQGLPSIVGWSCVLATLRTVFKIQSGEEVGESDYQGVLASVPLTAEKQQILTDTIETLCRRFDKVYGSPLMPKFEEVGSPTGVVEAVAVREGVL